MTIFGTDACVAGVGDQGKWVRPVPIRPEQVEGMDPDFRYDRYTDVELGPAPSGGQAEDRTLLKISKTTRSIHPKMRLQLLDESMDPSVAAALSPGRSLGLVSARNCRLEARRHTGGRKYLRICFMDAAGETYDWICAELTLNRNWRKAMREDESGWLDRVGRVLSDLDLVHAVALGDRNDRFPGRYDGRHPLCVGIHARDLAGDALDALLR